MDFIGEHASVSLPTGWVEAGVAYGSPPGLGRFFGSHEVAWFGSRIYDATARLDSDADPTRERGENNSGYIPVNQTEAAYKADALKSGEDCGSWAEDWANGNSGTCTVK